MYPEHMQESLKKVIASRNRRFELAKSGKPVFPPMDADEREDVLTRFHPDYEKESRRKVRIGPNKGELITTEIAVVSSETTITTASVSSVIPTAARCRVPTPSGRSALRVRGRIAPAAGPTACHPALHRGAPR